MDLLTRTTYRLSAHPCHSLGTAALDQGRKERLVPARSGRGHRGKAAAGKLRWLLHKEHRTHTRVAVHTRSNTGHTHTSARTRHTHTGRWTPFPPAGAPWLTSRSAWVKDGSSESFSAISSGRYLSSMAAVNPPRAAAALPPGPGAHPAGGAAPSLCSGGKGTRDVGRQPGTVGNSPYRSNCRRPTRRRLSGAAPPPQVYIAPLKPRPPAGRRGRAHRTLLLGGADPPPSIASEQLTIGRLRLSLPGHLRLLIGWCRSPPLGWAGSRAAAVGAGGGSASLNPSCTAAARGPPLPPRTERALEPPLRKSPARRGREAGSTLAVAAILTGRAPRYQCKTSLRGGAAGQKA